MKLLTWVWIVGSGIVGTFVLNVISLGAIGTCAPPSIPMLKPEPKV